MRKAKTEAIAGSLILEASATIAIAMLLLVAFQVGMVGVKRLEATAEVQNRGLLVLANAVERLESMAPVSENQAAQVLSQEFERSGFGGSSHYTPRCAVTSVGLDLSIVDPEGDALVAVRLGP